MNLNPIKIIRFAWKIFKGWKSSPRDTRIGLLKQAREVYRLFRLNRLEPEEYCRYGLYRKDIPWESKAAYISNNQFYLIETAMNPRKEVGILNKFTFRTYARFFDLPMAEFYGVFDPGAGFTAYSKSLQSVDDLKVLFANPAIDEFVIKPTSCGHGTGILVCRNNRDDTIHIFGEGDISIPVLHERLSGTHHHMHQLIPDSYVIEERIKQHSFLDNYNKNCVQAMRVITYMTSSGEIDILLLHQKFGVTGKYTDNVVGRGGFSTTIDNDGVFNPARQFTGDGWITFDKHPETGFLITGQKLPYFHEAVELAKRAQSLMPQLRLVAWDIAVTDDGPVLLEGNHGWDHAPMQMMEQRGFIAGKFGGDVYELMRRMWSGV